MKTNNENVAHAFNRISVNLDLNVYSDNMSLCKVYTENKDDNIIGIKSYNTVIAYRDVTKNVYLLNTRTYSNTTSKHQAYLRRATSSYIEIYDVNVTNEENLNHFITDLKMYANQQVRAKKREYSEIINITIQNLRDFLEYINLDKRSKLYKECEKIIKINKDDLISYLLNLSADEKTQADKLKKQRQAKIKRELVKSFKSLNLEDIKMFIQERETAFFNYDTDYKLFIQLEYKYISLCRKIRALHSAKFDVKQYEFVLQNSDLIRLSDNCNLITSQRVIISREDVTGLYFAIIKNEISVGDKILNWRCEVVNDNYIKIGCHTFSIEHIKNVYKIFKGCKNV